MVVGRHLKHFYKCVFEYPNKRDGQVVITTSMQDDNGQGDLGIEQVNDHSVFALPSAIQQVFKPPWPLLFGHRTFRVFHKKVTT